MYLWVDPVQEIVGAYFSVVREMIGQIRHVWCADLFVNAVMATIDD